MVFMLSWCKYSSRKDEKNKQRRLNGMLKKSDARDFQGKEFPSNVWLIQCRILSVHEEAKTKEDIIGMLTL